MIKNESNYIPEAGAKKRVWAILHQHAYQTEHFYATNLYTKVHKKEKQPKSDENQSEYIPIKCCTRLLHPSLSVHRGAKFIAFFEESKGFRRRFWHLSLVTANNQNRAHLKHIPLWLT